jgi:hypothetical protein
LSRHSLAEDQLDTPPFPGDANSMAWRTLQAYSGSYAWQARTCRAAYQALKVLQLALVASSPTVAAAVDARTNVRAAARGAAVLAPEGNEQLFQSYGNWIYYVATAESVWRETLLYSTPPGPYAHATTQQQMLAARLAVVISGENDPWAAGAPRAAQDLSQSPG